MFKCSGRYNISESNKGTDLYNQMSKCESEIKANCSFTLGNEDISNLSKCKTTMESFKWVNLYNSHKTNHFRNKVKQCKETITDCECWNEAADNIEIVKDCMIGIKFYFFFNIYSNLFF